MRRKYINTSINEWVSNSNMTKHHIGEMIRSIQKRSKNKITRVQLDKTETEQGLDYHFKWIRDHVIFEKILKQYQSNLIDKGILISYTKRSITEYSLGGKSGLDIIKSKLSECMEFHIYVKNIYTERVNPPKYIYHVTDGSYRDSIREKGLLVKSSNEGNWSSDHKLSYPSTIFAIDDYSYWSNKKSRNEDIWRIDTEKLGNKWWKDLNFYKKFNRHDVNTYMTFDNIPPDCINLMFEKRINERKNYGDLYHFTSLLFLVLILDSNFLEGSGIKWDYDRRDLDWGKGYTHYISFTRDKRFIDRTEKNLHSGGKSGIVVDGESMSDRFKIRPFNYTHSDGAYSDESEESFILKGDRINNIRNYIKYLIIPSFNNFESELNSGYTSGIDIDTIIENVCENLDIEIDMEDIHLDSTEMRKFYNILINYIKETKIPYEIH